CAREGETNWNFDLW
nr:immunoglobulin heavy chain junction region [Macaca mulatta]MOW80109.1 immunoglobulin heavy chain junction region [Macaca mulatta]